MTGGNCLKHSQSITCTHVSTRASALRASEGKKRPALFLRVQLNEDIPFAKVGNEGVLNGILAFRVRESEVGAFHLKQEGDGHPAVALGIRRPQVELIGTFALVITAHNADSFQRLAGFMGNQRKRHGSHLFFKIGPLRRAIAGLEDKERPGEGDAFQEVMQEFHRQGFYQ